MTRTERVESAAQDESVWERVRKRIDFTTSETGCWLWTGCVHEDGYGVFTAHGGTLRVHRYMYSRAGNRLLPGFELDHLCHTRRCCNPDHVEQVTTRVNQLRSTETLSSKNLAKTHCPQAHLYDAVNTRIEYSKGLPSRKCKQCDRQRAREAYHRKKSLTSQLALC